MSNIVKKKQYDFVNLAKFISAVFVIGIHTSPLQGLHPKLNYFTRCIVFRLAVPFFFICSGYFLAEKLFDEDKKKVKDYVNKYILNILNIYILWSIIYTLLNFNTYFGDGNIIKNIILVVARFLFKGAYIQLWYLSAICVSVYLIYIILDKYNFKVLIFISLLFYIFGLLGDLYYGFIDKTILGNMMNIYFSLFGEMFNSFTWGMIFIVMGIGVNKFNLNSKIKNNFIINMILFLLFTIESFTLKSFDIPKDNCTSISLLLLTPMIFMYILNLDEKYTNIYILRKNSSVLRQLSLYMYLIHGVFLIFLPFLYNKMNISNEPWINLFNFILVTIGSIISSLILMKSKSKVSEFIRKPKFIKYNIFTYKNIFTNIYTK